MTVERQVWDQIRAGRAPDPALVAGIARAEQAVLGAVGAAVVSERLSSTVLGAGPLEELLHDPAVTDVAVNGDGSVWVDRGAGMQRVPVALGSVGERRALAVRLAALAGRRLDDAAAYVDAVLPTGVRLHAILPPLVAEGAHLTLRVPARRPMRVEDLLAAGTIPREWAGVLRRLVTRRVSFLVSGGTGAGKTTVLAALLGCADPAERIVVVEDVRELAIEHPHVVRLEGRPANVEGAGEVSMVTLLRQALRMRPDRIVVGEVRGAEVRELLAALNTGHDGGAGTVHANAPADVVARMEALGALAGMSLPAVHAQLQSAIAVVVQVRRHGTARVVESVGVLLGEAGCRPTVVPVLAREPGRSADIDPAALTAGLQRLGALVGQDVLP